MSKKLASHGVKQSALKLAVVSALIFGGVTTVSAGTVGGSVTAINTVTTNDVSNITIGSSTPGSSNAQTDTIITSGTIDNNFDGGWKLTVVSANVGKLVRTGGGGAGREILYTNIKFVKTGGTLGAGLSDPDGQNKNIVTGASGGGVAGTTIFNTGSAVGTPGTATTATVNYGYALKISWSNDSSLLQGTYTDTVTLTLANDT